MGHQHRQKHQKNGPKLGGSAPHTPQTHTPAFSPSYVRCVLDTHVASSRVFHQRPQRRRSHSGIGPRPASSQTASLSQRHRSQTGIVPDGIALTAASVPDRHRPRRHRSHSGIGSRPASSQTASLSQRHRPQTGLVPDGIALTAASVPDLLDLGSCCTPCVACRGPTIPAVANYVPREGRRGTPFPIQN
jgi:hypothetical protein